MAPVSCPTGSSVRLNRSPGRRSGSSAALAEGAILYGGIVGGWIRIRSTSIPTAMKRAGGASSGAAVRPDVAFAGKVAGAPGWGWCPSGSGCGRSVRSVQVILVRVARVEVAAADAFELFAHLPAHREQAHLEVAAERPERMLERRGLVPLGHEVS